MTRVNGRVGLLLYRDAVVAQTCRSHKAAVFAIHNDHLRGSSGRSDGKMKSAERTKLVVDQRGI